MPRTTRPRSGLSDGGRSMNTGETRLQTCGKVQTPLQGVNRFVSPTQQNVARQPSRRTRAAVVQAKTRTMCKIYHALRQPSSAATKCHSSTAENSPKRSWISRSDHSRKIQLVVRRRSPLTKCTRPRPSPHLHVGLHLDVDIPALVAALQLAHVLGALLAGEGGAHGEKSTLPRGFLPVRFRPR